MRAWLLVFLCGLPTLASAVDDVAVGCYHLHLALDSGLSPGVLESAWASGESTSAAPAVLELLGCSGEVLDHMKLAAPLAKLDPTPLRGTPFPTYLVSEDLTAAAGSYSGPLTLPIQVAGKHLVPAVARTADGNVEAIHLPLTGKAAWKKVLARNADDLLAVSCQPQDNGFRVFYRRYHPTRHGWEVRLRSEPGLWESDGDFPTIRSFP